MDNNRNDYIQMYKIIIQKTNVLPQFVSSVSLNVYNLSINVQSLIFCFGVALDFEILIYVKYLALVLHLISIVQHVIREYR